ncbi:XAC2610-related protein [Chryseobacterium sp.]|uniref:XAC2610-related protein n=1 Tax=Chryseobacterium sp. TaxID=1871047 RepID=UPI002FC75857
MKSFKILFLIAVFFACRYNAQPFNLKSVGEAKEFGLKIYYGTHGKGAFVQYKGQKGIIPLQIKSFNVDKSGREDGQPDFTSYIWEEIIDGKINGTYYLTEGLRDLFDVKYIRKKDNRTFKFEEDKTEKFDGVSKFLLHDVMIDYNIVYDDRLKFMYSNKQTVNLELPDMDNPNYSRQAIIEDYNFDGFDDISFSIPDGGMGVYRVFTVFIYNAKTKKFEKLIEPDFSKSKCECLCDLKMDKNKKIISSECRGGARWWKDLYQYKAGKLVWVRSQEIVD